MLVAERCGHVDWGAQGVVFRDGDVSVGENEQGCDLQVACTCGKEQGSSA